MKKVIVTGSSRGIGRAVALDLAKAGFDPVVHCVSRVEAAAEVAAEVKALGGTGDVLRFDVGDRAAAKEALEAWVAANGAPWGVVLNAGIAADGFDAAKNALDAGNVDAAKDAIKDVHQGIKSAIKDSAVSDAVKSIDLKKAGDGLKDLFK